MDSLFTIELVTKTSNDFMRSQMKSDFYIAVGQKKHECHKFLMISHSGVIFRRIHEDPTAQSITLPDTVDNDQLDIIISYIYGAKLRINLKTVEDIDYVARILEIPSILEITGSFMLCKEILKSISSEISLSVPPLSEYSSNLISKNFLLFYQYIGNATPVNAFFILNNPNLTVYSEDILLHWTIKIIMNCSHSKDSLNLLKSIHLNKISESVMAGLKASRNNYNVVLNEIDALLEIGDFSKIPPRKPVEMPAKESMIDFLSNFSFKEVSQ